MFRFSQLSASAREAFLNNNNNNEGEDNDRKQPKSNKSQARRPGQTTAIQPLPSVFILQFSIILEPKPVDIPQTPHTNTHLDEVAYPNLRIATEAAVYLFDLLHGPGIASDEAPWDPPKIDGEVVRTWGAGDEDRFTQAELGDVKGSHGCRRISAACVGGGTVMIEVRRVPIVRSVMGMEERMQGLLK